MSSDQDLSQHIKAGDSSEWLATGTYLYRQGEACANFYVLHSGWIVLSTVTRDGAVQILDFAVDGHVLGLGSVAGPMRHTAQCLTAVDLQIFPRARLDELLEQEGELRRRLLEAACLNEARAHHRLVHLGLRDARARVAQLLIGLYARITGHLPNQVGESLEMPLTQRHIAQATGLSGEHVNRTLRRLREQGVLHFTKHRLCVLDPQSLLIDGP